MTEVFQPLLARMQELKDLSGAIGLLTWDQETYLPKKGAAGRADQLATLQALHHERLVDPKLGELIAGAETHGSLDADSRAMVRVLRWERDRAVRVPESLVRELSQAQSRGLNAWHQARSERSFASFKPALARLLELRRAEADAIGYDGGERYDALLDAFEPGMRTGRLQGVLEALERQLVPIANALCERPAPRDWLSGEFPKAAQWRLCERLLDDMGFDREAGRLDESVHPFTGGTHALDVRLTTRVNTKDLRQALYGAVHEGGHGLYEQGFSAAHHRTPLSSAPSMGMHESQSRLWENMVGRGRAFWRRYAPLLVAEFPEALKGADAEGLYRAANRVTRSPIRVDADEVTYNLHILLRFQLELLLVRDALPLDELPSQWNERTERMIGVRPTDDVQGVLQDIHWAYGELGYFPTYALGNLYAASLFAAAGRELTGLEGSIERGDFAPLRNWLKERVHSQGHRYPAEELVTRITGTGLTDTDFVAYVKRKFGDMYGVSWGS